MVTSREGSPAQLKTRGSEWRALSFDQVVWEDLRRMNECGLLPYWNFPEGFDGSIDGLNWEECQFDAATFRSFSGSQEENAAWDLYLKTYIPLGTGSYGLLSRGLYELNLRPWLAEFNYEDFLVLRLEAMSQEDEGIEKTLMSVWNHLNIPPIGALPDLSLIHISEPTRPY